MGVSPGPPSVPRSTFGGRGDRSVSGDDIGSGQVDFRPSTRPSLSSIFGSSSGAASCPARTYKVRTSKVEGPLRFTTQKGGQRAHAGGAGGAPRLAVRRADPRRGLLRPGNPRGNGRARDQGRVDELLRLPCGTSRFRGGGSIFYGFHPRKVERAIPDAWAYAEPRQLIDARLSAMDAALRRLLGEAIDGPDVRRAAALATAAVHSADFSGRPLGAANAALADPGAPHLQLWQALGAMREHRGDGHVTCLVANQVDPCESLVMQAATGRSERDSLRTNRGWSDEEWRTAVMRLRERGWLDDDELPTPSGTKARDAIEAATDRLAAPLVATLGARGVELVEAMRPLAERIMAAGEVPRRNNMGLPWPSQ